MFLQILFCICNISEFSIFCIEEGRDGLLEINCWRSGGVEYFCRRRRLTGLLK